MKLTDNYKQYMKISDQLTFLLDLPGFDETEEYDHLLDESDEFWWAMTAYEILYIEYTNLLYNVTLDPSECWIGIDGWE